LYHAIREGNRPANRNPSTFARFPVACRPMRAILELRANGKERSSCHPGFRLANSRTRRFFSFLPFSCVIPDKQGLLLSPLLLCDSFSRPPV
jgi:hypothetical protein